MRFGKAKASESSLEATQSGLAELRAIMMQIAERLDVLEKKMDLVINQTAARSFASREPLKPVPQSSVAPQSLRQPDPTQRPKEVKPAQGQPRAHNRERRERVLHKAVCADCQKDCEIPFKPTGERPVFCKECFSKRKAGPSAKADQGNHQVLDPQERHVIVTKKGVGKVTISEVARFSSRDSSAKNKSPKPASKSK